VRGRKEREREEGSERAEVRTFCGQVESCDKERTKREQRQNERPNRNEVTRGPKEKKTFASSKSDMMFGRVSKSSPLNTSTEPTTNVKRPRSKNKRRTIQPEVNL
jgi:hypothetical protein